MENKDLYSILGVSKDASDAEIKSQYRKLSKKYHPDMQAGKSESEKKEAEEKFKEINQAYSILSNKEKRQHYDTYGSSDFQSGGNDFDPFDFFRSQFGGENPFGGMFGRSPFGNFNGFGHRHNASNVNDEPEDGRNLKMNLDISFKESLYGCVKEFDINTYEECDECNGKGIDKNSKSHECHTCHGTGQIVHTEQHGFMMSQTISACPSCHGTGTFSIPCKKCNGVKRTKKTTHISIPIEKGIENGKRIVIKGKGECGIRGGSNGDLYVVVNVDQSKLFERHDLDLYTTTYVNPIIASIGGSIDVQTPWGISTIRIPASIKNGTRLRVKGCGMKTSSTAGDLIVEIVVSSLKNLDNSQIDALKKVLDKCTCGNVSQYDEYKNLVNEFSSSK